MTLNLDFEEDLTVLSAEEDAEFDDFDEFFLAQDKTGPSIDQVLAEKVNAGLCRKADKEMLGKLMKKSFHVLEILQTSKPLR